MDAFLLYVKTCLYALYWATFGSWLWNLYRFGPYVTAWGFWAGMADEEVCARLASGTQALDWLGPNGPTVACTALISRSFQTFVVVIHTFLYMVTAWTAVKAACQMWERKSLLRTLAQELRVLHNDRKEKEYQM